MKSSMNLKLKMTLAAILVTIMPLSIILTSVFSYFQADSKERAKQYSVSNMRKLGQSLDSIFQGINDISLYLIASSRIRNYLFCKPGQINSLAYSQLVNSAFEDLYIAPYSTQYVSSMSVFRLDDRFISTEANIIGLSKEDREKAIQLNGRYFWSSRVENGQLKALSYVRLIRNPSRLQEQLGFLRITIRISAIGQLFHEPSNLQSLEYMITDPEGSFFLLSEGSNIAQVMVTQDDWPDTRPLSESVYVKTFNKTNLIISAYTFLNGQLTAYSFMPDTFQKQYSVLLVLILVSMTALYLVICLALLFFLTRVVIRPLGKLGHYMQVISQENFEVRIPVTGQDELATLARQFNDMASRLDYLYRENYLGRTRLKEAELAVLVAKINPHFLYNTLDNIYWMADMKETEDVKKMVSSLSTLFRISLSGDENGFVPLSRELEHIRCYLTIQSYRYKDKVQTIFEVESGIDDLSVLKLLLQPLVENTFVHGMDSSDGGRIDIRIFVEGDALIYSIYNSGKSPEPDEINHFLENPISSGRGFALSNINERIKLKFGDKYGLTYRNPVTGGAMFIIRQPIIRRGDSHDQAISG